MAADTDKNDSNLICEKLNIDVESRSVAGGKIKKMYTNRTFQEDLGAFIKVSFMSLQCNWNITNNYTPKLNSSKKIQNLTKSSTDEIYQGRKMLFYKYISNENITNRYIIKEMGLILILAGSWGRGTRIYT